MARKYSEAHPGESLKGKRFKVTTGGGKPGGQQVTMISMEDFMKADDDGRVDAWLHGMEAELRRNP